MTEQTFKCGFCDAAFRTRHELMDHVQKVHKGMVKEMKEDTEAARAIR